MSEQSPNDLKNLMQDHYLRYASYVILDRAIPDIADGLKPVQRRILLTLWNINDGRFHKVANVVGQTMALHPHGDAAITDALINVSNKGFLLDEQGNFGNIYTGDPAAASRYIETRLSPLALQTMFNPDITEMLPSYDGRNQEALRLPAKIPLLLMQGAEGIAVGMSTRVLPHNFVELLEAQIAVLEGEKYILYPDFITGGIMDASQYNRGNGKVKLRAKIEIRDPKTLVITEICHGTTTESLIRSIDEAAKKGKIKIDSIDDYTAEHVEIEITLPRGQYAKDLIEPLYAFTDCEVSVNSNVVVIKEGFPVEINVHEILAYNTDLLKGYLKRELEIERDRLKEKIFEKTLEQIFIENRIYKKIEEIKTYEEIHKVIEKALKPYHKKLYRIPVREDRERLLSIPIRRISRYDFERNRQDIKAYKEQLVEVEKKLKQIKRVTISYLKDLIKKYGKEFPRKTLIGEITEIDRRAIQTKKVTVSFDPKQGFVGTKVKNGYSFECTNFDKLLVIYRDGTLKAINIPDKQFLQTDGKKVAFVGVADKKTEFNVIYSDAKKICYAKRFVVDKFILDKEYRYFNSSGKLEYISTNPNITLTLKLVPKAKQKISSVNFDFNDVLAKGVKAKGVRVTPRPVKKVAPKDKKAAHQDPQLDFFNKLYRS
ncbi:MAG: DNA gyrase subunit A [Chlamydiae bacterium]|nr:DNA gyrase subunit A [Chlamydiota bacterium]